MTKMNNITQILYVGYCTKIKKVNAKKSKKGTCKSIIYNV